MKNPLNKSFVNGRPIGHSSCRAVGHSSCRASCATARARSFPPFGVPRVRAAFLAFLGLAAFASANAYAVTATKAYVDSRDDSTLSTANASISSAVAYTTGVSNKVEAAQSAAAANAAAIAAETKAREDAGYLTAESDPSTAVTNGVAWVRGKKVISEHQSLDAYLKTANVSSYVSAMNLNKIGDGYSGHFTTTLIMPMMNDETSTKRVRASFYTTDYVKFLLSSRATTNALAEVKAMISATDATFSNAVLAVGIGTLGITTNDLQVVHDLAGMPVGTSITTVGGLLAALAAGLAALKKSVSSLSSKVDDANAALEEVA